MAVAPELKTSRLRIVPFGEQHLHERYLGWLNDQELMRYSEQRHKRHTIDTCREYLAGFHLSPHYFWALEEIREGLGHIGNINAYLDNYNCIADIGVLIGERAAQGKGLATEAVGTIIDYLFTKCGVRKVTAGAMALNRPMLMVMKHVGMVEDGARRRHYLFEGEEVDVIHMALFRENWALRQGGAG